MVKLNKIYTKTGDDGTTGLVGGGRMPKHSLRVEAYGSVDEAGAAIGVARLHVAVQDGDYDAMLNRIQHDLFDLGADLATVTETPGTEPLRIIESQVTRLEREMDIMNEELAPLHSFVLSGGSPAAAHLHLARTVVRRAERALTALAEKEKVNSWAVKYLNRLSDHLFIMARSVNEEGRADVLWKPGVNR